MNKIFAVAPLVVAISCSTVALAQDAGRPEPMAVPIPQDVPAAQDTPYPGGPIKLDIDASDPVRAAFRVTETIPLAAGTSKLVLQAPEWLPGHHAVSGPIAQYADVHFYSGGKELTWWRDPVEVFAFHIDLPAGAREVTAKFVSTSPLQLSEGRVTFTREMLDLQWTLMTLYPAGYYVRDIQVQPTVTFPEGWQLATALDGRKQQDNKVSWAQIDYQTLIDSPVFAGKYFKRFDLGHDVALDVVADKPGELAITPDHLAVYKDLVEEAFTAFGSHHFDHYDFLLGLTNRMGGVGLEHHRSSENTMKPETFVKWDAYDWNRNVIAHEFTHSWNGKFRRPAGLWTPDYRQPMIDSLLWVYEGQTQFWGLVLAARSGVQSKDMVLGALAGYAGLFTEQPGRDWRSVEDTTYDEIMNHRRPKPFSSLTRNEDYYIEGALVWLEADQIIREGTHGKKGLDDFAKAFFGIRNGDWGEVTYTFDDIVAALNGVYPYDWASFLKTRFYKARQPAPLGGIEKGGYGLVWKDTPNPYDKGKMGFYKNLDLTYSIGVSIAANGTVQSSRWDSPAFNAGVVNGARILAVNGEAYDAGGIEAAITAAKGTGKPIDLLIRRGDHFQTVDVDYHGGLRWPWLEKTVKGKAPLDRLLAPHRPGAASK